MLFAIGRITLVCSNFNCIEDRYRLFVFVYNLQEHGVHFTTERIRFILKLLIKRFSQIPSIGFNNKDQYDTLLTNLAKSIFSTSSIFFETVRTECFVWFSSFQVWWHSVEVVKRFVHKVAVEIVRKFVNDRGRRGLLNSLRKRFPVLGRA